MYPASDMRSLDNGKPLSSPAPPPALDAPPPCFSPAKAPRSSSPISMKRPGMQSPPRSQSRAAAPSSNPAMSPEPPIASALIERSRPRLRRHPHSVQQCRHHSPRLSGRTQRSRLGSGDGGECKSHFSNVAPGHSRDGSSGRRLHHQHGVRLGTGRRRQEQRSIAPRKARWFC